MHVGRLLFVLMSGALALVAADVPGLKSTVQAADASVSQYLVALPHIAYGGGWRTQIVIGNTSGAAATVSIYFYGNDGSPLNLAIGGVAGASTTVNVPANGELTVEPDWQSASSSAGWAGLVYSNSGLKIQGIFLWQNPASPAGQYVEAVAPIVSQAGVSCIVPLPSATTAVTMLYDQTAGHFSGYGFANTTNAAVTLGLTFYDQNGASIGQYSEIIPAFGHDEFLLTDPSRIPALANTKGTMHVSGSGIVTLGFRFTPNYTFTTWLP